MKKLFIVLALISMGANLVAQQDAYDLYVPGETSTISSLSQPEGQYIPNRAPGDPVLYDNGPLVTHPGGGFGGADASVLQTNLSMSTYGVGHQVLSNYWVADDFTVPAGGWNIAGFGFYAYQTGSGITSTLTAVHLIIYDGVPGNGGTNIVFGDGTTNRLTSTSFTNIYRVLDNSMLNTDRPIMLDDCKFNLNLAPGTYWIAWQTDGTLTFAGPWAPPVTILGQTTTGNGMQYTTAWGGYYDTGSNTPQGFPFLVYGQKGEPTSVPVSNWALFIGLGMILVFAVIRFRRIS